MYSGTEMKSFLLQIILSLFVAVILDNLDLDEDLKRLKQVSAPHLLSDINTFMIRLAPITPASCLPHHKVIVMESIIPWAPLFAIMGGL